MRDDAPPAEQSRWDSHPSIAARVAAMDRMPDVAVARDTRPAWVLIPGFEAHATELAARVVKVEGRTQLELGGADRDLPRAVPPADRRHRVPRGGPGGRAAAREPGHGARRGRAAAAAPRWRRTSAPRATSSRDLLELLVSQAAVQAGIARWRHSWSGPAELVGRDDQVLDLTPVASAALQPETVGAARARLAEIGVDVTSTGQVAETATAHGGEVLGGLASVKVDGAKHDVLVLDIGMILVPTPKKDEYGKSADDLAAAVGVGRAARVLPPVPRVRADRHRAHREADAAAAPT